MLISRELDWVPWLDELELPAPCLPGDRAALSACPDRLGCADQRETWAYQSWHAAAQHATHPAAPGESAVLPL